jgi:glutaredoxin 1
MYTVYSKPQCSYCVQAKQLLQSKNLPYVEKIVDVGQVKEEGKEYVTIQELKQLIPTATSVPQILHEDRLIGGFTQLMQYIGGQ